ncbi:MAG: T9SS type A sorting domain-containing protein [Bacteroidota bacterium]
MKKYILILFLLPLALFGQQQSIKVMHYNLLFYGYVNSFCTSSNNNIQTKDAALTDIINYTTPDIFTVNEVGSSNFAQERILNTVLNSNGRNHYAMGNIVNATGGTIDNMLYYDSRMFGLADQDVIATSVRDVDIYTLYFKSQDLSTHQDTAYLTCFVTHLKAGSSTSDQQLRADMTSDLMNYIDNEMTPGNFLLLGDLNVKSSSEQSYQNLLNHSNASIRFYDPIDTPGSWNNSSTYADIHTQSTHYSSNGCASGGGMDDRFDFILISEAIKNQSSHYSYQANSYQALANDGQHFNDAINYNGNTSVPANVLSALYTMSDHLPVLLNLTVDQPLSVAKISAPAIDISPNPVNQKLQLKISGAHQLKSVSIYSIQGKLVFQHSLQETSAHLDVSALQKGLYILEVKTTTDERIRKKIIKL